MKSKDNKFNSRNEKIEIPADSPDLINEYDSPYYKVDDDEDDDDIGFMGNFSGEGSPLYLADRNIGIINFAERVYENGRNSLGFEDGDKNYIKFTKIAMDNIMEFLSVRLPRLDCDERTRCIRVTFNLLTRMSKEFHLYILTNYQNWQKDHSYVFRNFNEIERKGARAFYPEIKEFDWGAKKVIDSVTPNTNTDKYPKMYFDFLIRTKDDKTTFTSPQNLVILENLFPTFGSFQTGDSSKVINLPILEDCFDFDNKKSSDMTKKKMDDFFTRINAETKVKEILSPCYARCIPDTSMDTLGQDGDYDLTMNYGNDTFRYAAMIRWTRNTEVGIQDIGNYVSCGIPSFENAVAIPIPYPEILDIDQFYYVIPNTIRYVENEESPIPGDGVINTLLKNVREKCYQETADQEAKWDTFFNHFREDTDVRKAGILLETPGVSYKFLFHPFKNTLNKKIRTLFISIYRLGEEPDYIIDLLRGLVRNGTYVYAYVEPMARGDEKANQRIIKELKSFGVHVCHKYKNLKVHMKAWLAIYEDNSMMGMIGTGNFNITTLQNYTDLHYITRSDSICKELLFIFKTIFSGADLKEFNKNPTMGKNILVTPVCGRDYLDNKIKKPNSVSFISTFYYMEPDDTRLFIKCNNFTDKHLVRTLHKYAPENSRLMIRTSTICYPTDKIEIRSKVSNRLEHSRIYVFGKSVLISSADLMKRNLDKRVELFLLLPEGSTDLRVYTSDRVSSDGFSLTQSVDFDTYIDNLWDSCNYKLDEFTTKWKVCSK